MTLLKRLGPTAIGLMFVAVFSSAAHAQSAIGGTVKDASGAVLPGVTVEVWSDVLIEKTRSVATDGNGEYKIVDLRPGVYVITFSLEGFSAFKREGLELPSNFTATINAEMKVGALEESVTVSGASPVVDVQTNQKTQVLSRDGLDSVPSAKTIQSLGQLVVGVTLSSPDVGGSRAMQQAYLTCTGQRLGCDCHRGRPADEWQHGGRRGDGVSQRSDDSGGCLPDRRGHRRDHNRRRHDEPGAQGWRQPLHGRAEVPPSHRRTGRAITSPTA